MLRSKPTVLETGGRSDLACRTLDSPAPLLLSPAAVSLREALVSFETGFLEDWLGFLPRLYSSLEDMCLLLEESLPVLDLDPTDDRRVSASLCCDEAKEETSDTSE